MIENEAYIDKYNTRIKAEEYAKMAWPVFADSSVSEPFYASIALLVNKYAGRSAQPRPSFLEVGFGAGRTLYDIHMSGRAGRITGIEQSPAMLEIADKILIRQDSIDIDRKTMVGKGLTNIELLKGSIQHIPFGDNTFHFLVCINVLDRIKDTIKGISELVRVLLPDGILIVATAFDYGSITSKNQRLSQERLVQAFVFRDCSLIEKQKTNCLRIPVAFQGNLLNIYMSLKKQPRKYKQYDRAI